MTATGIASAPARVLPGGFRVGEKLSQGAFATVFSGIDDDGLPVAIKVLRQRDKRSSARFRREIKVLQALPPSENVVAYRGHGVTWNGSLFLAMELVDGYTLGELLETEHHLTEAKACALMLQLCTSFAGLHSLGMTHGDIKPENIMLDPSGPTVKLLDFGMARDTQGLVQLLEREGHLPGDEFASDLDSGVVAGTPEYISPELFTDAKLRDPSALRTDTPADVFGLGVIFYELLTGVAPWPFRPKAKTRRAFRVEVLRYLEDRVAAMEEPLERPPSMSQALWSIIFKALQLDPKARQGDARLLHADIMRYLEHGVGVREAQAPVPIMAGLMVGEYDRTIADVPRAFFNIAPTERPSANNDDREGPPSHGPVRRRDTALVATAPEPVVEWPPAIEVGWALVVSALCAMLLTM